MHCGAVLCILGSLTLWRLCLALGNADAAFILHGMAQKSGAQPAVVSGKDGIDSTPGSDAAAEGQMEEEEGAEEQDEVELEDAPEDALEDTEEEAMKRYLERKQQQQRKGAGVGVSPAPQPVLLPVLETLRESGPLNHSTSQPIGTGTLTEEDGGRRHRDEDRHGAGSADDLSPVSRVMRGENLEQVARQVVRARMQQQHQQQQQPYPAAQRAELNAAAHSPLQDYQRPVPPQGAVKVAGALLSVQDDQLEKVRPPAMHATGFLASHIPSCTALSAASGGSEQLATLIEMVSQRLRSRRAAC